MKEIISVKLENEMDIILAHRRAMKLLELAGCSLVTQTTIATAVSEISRCAIDYGQAARVSFFIEAAGVRKFFRAEILDRDDFCAKSADALTYARRLVGDLQVLRKPGQTTVVMRFQLNFAGTLSDAKINSIRSYFDLEPPLNAYDELRRKNQLLQDMADKIKETENEYKTLSDTLPLMMFSADKRGQVVFANRWLQTFLGVTPRELQSAAWQNFVFPADFSAFSRDTQSMVATLTPLSGQYRIREKSSGNFLWHMVSVIPLKNEKEMLSGWIGFLVDIHAQKLVEQTLKDNKELKSTQEKLFEYQDELERKVVELNRSNYELEQFAHLASHDLQEPLRKLFFYSDVLKRKYLHAVDESGVTILNNMNSAAGRMKELIQDLLSYSRLHQQKFTREEVDLNEVMQEILKDLELSIRDKAAVIHVGTLPIVFGNQLRLQQLLMNLVSNSLKYTRKDITPVVNIDSQQTNGEVIIRVKDNGIGFDPQYSEKIFGLFERLHSRDQYPGTGIGLSICKKIAELHGGSISASSKPNEYALFQLHLPVSQTQ